MMPKTQRLVKSELAEKYSDPDTQQNLIMLANLVSFLERSILAPDYRIPDDLNNAIQLTPYGSKICNQLITKEKVPAKEARLLCFLTMFHTELMVDLDKTNFAAIRQAIHNDILNRRLRFPLVFGTDLYRRAAELYSDERDSLSFSETNRVLEDMPIGIFQLSHLLIGPYGMLDSAEKRWIPPTQSVPFYHCSDITCAAVHRCRLSTDRDSPVNEHWPKMEKQLTADSPDPSEWGELLLDIMGAKARSYDDKSAATLPFLIGDSLSDDELRTLFCDLLDSTQGSVRKSLEQVHLKGAAVVIAENLERAALLQLVLLATDEAIGTSLDRLIESADIVVPVGEVRLPIVNRAIRLGQFGLQPQMSRYGVRFHATQSELGPLRLRRLVDRLYVLDESSDVAELEWQLRGVDAPNLTARLDEFVRTSTPEEVLKRLVLARRTNMIAACTELGVDEHRSRSDEHLIQTLLWKLGFDFIDRTDENARFWQLHEKMKQLTQTAGVSALVDQEAVRALASNYFVLLEALLDDSLAFVTWALTTDHLTCTDPFVYNAEACRKTSFNLLNDIERKRGAHDETVSFSEKSSLYELCRGFGTLAYHLEAVAGEQGGYRRSADDYPEYVKYSTIKSFPFQHKLPYLDLLPDSQNAVVGHLRSICKSLVSADVSGVRNDQLHFRRSTADLGRLSACLSAVESAANSLEQQGFTRLPFRLSRNQGDQWSRRIFVLADPRGREIAFARPSAYDRLRLPSLTTPQYLMTCALFAGPNEILRFRNRTSSDYSRLLEDYPLPRQPQAGMIDMNSAEPASRGRIGSSASGEIG